MTNIYINLSQNTHYDNLPINDHLVIVDEWDSEELDRLIVICYIDGKPRIYCPQKFFDFVNSSISKNYGYYKGIEMIVDPAIDYIMVIS